MPTLGRFVVSLKLMFIVIFTFMFVEPLMLLFMFIFVEVSCIGRIFFCFLPKSCELGLNVLFCNCFGQVTDASLDMFSGT